MKKNNRRDFLKKSILASTSLLLAPSLLNASSGKSEENLAWPNVSQDKLITPGNNGLKITGTFLDEISHDIPTRTGDGKNGRRISSI